MRTWIDIGVPSRKKLRQGMRAADRVILYTYGPAALLRQVLSAADSDRIEAWWLDRHFLLALASSMKGRSAIWQLTLDGDDIVVGALRGVRTRLTPP